MTKPQLRVWLNNFRTNSESYFAACILDSLIFRSTEQTVALVEQLFARVLPDLAREHSILQGSENHWHNQLSETSPASDPNIRIVPVIRQNDPPTKSGPLLARMYRHHIGLNDRWMIWPWQINDKRNAKVETFLFIDDFSGTGTQFLKFASFFEIEKKLEARTAIYAPLVAHQVGLSKLKSDATWLKVCSVERLDQTANLFHKASTTFQDGVNSHSDARCFYFDMLRSRSLNIRPRFAAGYGRLALTYVFEHATPNNCIPLLWYSGPNWESLFRR